MRQFFYYMYTLCSKACLSETRPSSPKTPLNWLTSCVYVVAYAKTRYTIISTHRYRSHVCFMLLCSKHNVLVPISPWRCKGVAMCYIQGFIWGGSAGEARAQLPLPTATNGD